MKRLPPMRVGMQWVAMSMSMWHGGGGEKESGKGGKREDGDGDGTGTTLAVPWERHGRRAKNYKVPFPTKTSEFVPAQLGLASMEHAMQGSCRAVGYGKETGMGLPRYTVSSTK